MFDENKIKVQRNADENAESRGVVTSDRQNEGQCCDNAKEQRRLSRVKLTPEQQDEFITDWDHKLSRSYDGRSGP
jgi:hypothetical protein